MTLPNPNPNTTGLRPFKKGQSGNPAGKSSAQRRLEIDNAERATRVQNEFLRQLEARIERAGDQGNAVAIQMINARNLKLIKDAQDRSLGRSQ